MKRCQGSAGRAPRQIRGGVSTIWGQFSNEKEANKVSVFQAGALYISRLNFLSALCLMISCSRADGVLG